MIDNYDLWEVHQRDQDEALVRLPVCNWCGEPIQDEQCFKLDGEVVCEACIDALKVYTADLIGE